jgi:chromosome segregation ATPase
MRCPSCGGAADSFSHFCCHCGKPLSSSRKAPVPGASPFEPARERLAAARRLLEGDEILHALAEDPLTASFAKDRVREILSSSSNGSSVNDPNPRLHIERLRRESAEKSVAEVMRSYDELVRENCTLRARDEEVRRLVETVRREALAIESRMASQVEEAREKERAAKNEAGALSALLSDAEKEIQGLSKQILAAEEGRDEAMRQSFALSERLTNLDSSLLRGSLLERENERERLLVQCENSAADASKQKFKAKSYKQRWMDLRTREAAAAEEVRACGDKIADLTAENSRLLSSTESLSREVLVLQGEVSRWQGEKRALERELRDKDQLYFAVKQQKDALERDIFKLTNDFARAQVH